MKWLSVTGTGLAITAIGLAVACGGGGAKPPREVTADDLPLMVLQREDVPDELRQIPDSPSVPRLRQDGVSGAQASYLAEYELPSADPGDISCISSGAYLYPDAESTGSAFREVEEFEKGDLEEEEEGFEIERVSLPSLGDESIGVRFVSPHSVVCRSEDEPTEAHLIVFRHRNVVGALLVNVYDRGASLDEAVRLAQKQIDRMEAVFAGEDS